MSSIRIVTDSASQIDPDLADEFEITVVPLKISFGAQKLREGVDLTTEEFFRRTARGPAIPRASAPTIETFRQVYAELSQSTDRILSVHVSDGLSDTCANARSAASFFLGRCEIVVIDSMTISLGLNILVRAAAHVVAEGASMEDVVRVVRGMIPHIYAVFFTDTLEYLERDHHLSKSQTILGTMLGIRPFLAVEEGTIIPMEKVRSRDKAIDKLVDFVSEFARVEQATVVHSLNRAGKDGRVLLERLRSSFPEYEFNSYVYGPALGTYIGPQGLGLIVYEGME